MELIVRRQTPEGFTLVEILIAMGLMAMGILGVAPLFTNSLTSNAAGDDFSRLNSLARQQLEQCLQYGFDDPRLAVPAGSTYTMLDEAGASHTYVGVLYRNQTALTQSVGGTTATIPYELVYTVQDFPIDKLGSATLPNGLTDAVVDSDVAWQTGSGGKLITVYGAARRRSGGRTSYTRAGILSASATGKQVRIMAYKSP
jgi:prepilin-type N-terminal cleavage/methylation domain-containing protein